MLNTVVNPMLNLLGGGGNKGNQLIQTGGTFNSLSATLTPMFVGALIGNVTKERVLSGEITMANINPVLFIAMAVFAAAFFILLLFPLLIHIRYKQLERKLNSNIVRGISVTLY